MCVFCEIAKGNIPSYKVYEDENCLAFLDLSQVTIGHTLVIPKKHIENIFDLNDEDACKFIKVVTKVAKIVKEKTNAKAINILNNSGEVAGQSVMHLHFHLIPRYDKDEINLAPAPLNPSKEKMEEIYSMFN